MAEVPSGPEADPQEMSPEDSQRRGFLVELSAWVVGSLVALFGFAVGMFSFLDPLMRKADVPRKYRKQRAGGQTGFIRVATLSSVPNDGQPRMFPVLADRVDAWNYYPNEPVGSVFLRRLDEEKVECLHATCPHLGCTINFADDRGVFRCPCHESSFQLDGSKINEAGKVNPAPRPMDSLEVDQQRLAETGEVWVKFVNFRTGEAEKTAIE